jgi:glycosyltransferase involved in cell wall biosynthesis
MARRLIIDCQIFQTPAWYRGMGKYSLELIKALAQSKGANNWSQIDVLLSSSLKTDPDVITEMNAINGISFVELDIAANNIRNEQMAEQNRVVIDAYTAGLKTKPQDIDFLILSLMQGEIFPVFPSSEAVHKSLLFYDLIPIMFHDVYLESPIARAGYLPKITELLKADMYFTISKTVANDLSLYLGINKARIVNIDGGPINHSTKTRPVNVTKPFILMPTGNDPRKNNRKGIQGFNEFNKLQQGKYSLVVTSFFKDSEKKELSELAENVHFTDNVSGEELGYLYENSAALLFPSEYEGLGLPILEAVEKDKPIACSNISVFQEISQTAFHYFEPRSVSSIERALSKLIGSPEVDKKTYQSIIKKYTWTNSVSQMVSSMMQYQKPVKPVAKQSVAIFAPDPSGDSVCARQIQDAHGELSRFFNATYYFSGSKGNRRINYLSQITNTHHISSGLAFAPEGQIPVYHLSNDAACSKVLFCALAVPGIVLLYDLQLNSVWEGLVDQKLINRQRHELEVQINTENKVEGTKMLASLIKNQKALVVFNKSRQEIVQKLAKKIDSTAAVYTVDVPLGELAYADAKPSKTIDIGELYRGSLASGDRKIKTKIDTVYDEVLSKIKVLIFDQMSSAYDVLSAMRFGVIPIISSNTENAQVFGKAVEQYQTIGGAKQKAEVLVTDPQRANKAYASMAKLVKTQSVVRFAEQLQSIIGEVKQ